MTDLHMPELPQPFMEWSAAFNCLRALVHAGFVHVQLGTPTETFFEACPWLRRSEVTAWSGVYIYRDHTDAAVQVWLALMLDNLWDELQEGLP